MHVLSLNENVNTFIKGVNGELSGVIAIALVDIHSDIILGKYSSLSSFNVEIAIPYHIKLVKTLMKANEALGIKQKIDDILITLSNQYHLIKVSANGEYMSYLVVEKANASLGTIRAVINEFFGRFTMMDCLRLAKSHSPHPPRK